MRQEPKKLVKFFILYVENGQTLKTFCLLEEQLSEDQIQRLSERGSSAEFAPRDPTEMVYRLSNDSLLKQQTYLAENLTITHEGIQYSLALALTESLSASPCLQCQYYKHILSQEINAP